LGKQQPSLTSGYTDFSSFAGARRLRASAKASSNG
jgi:hypothetical protein